jgi:polysaccharide export outer membrane protein
MITLTVFQYERFLIMLAACFLCLLCMGGFSRTGLHPLMAQEPASRETNPGTQGGDYLIGAGDVLEILVWREPDLSRIVTVRPDGKISLPLVDDVQASQGTLLDLKKRLTEQLSGYVDKPSVYVMLQENRSKKIYMVGKINSPGEYPLEKNMTVLQAIARAGGFGEWAGKDDIIIVRKTPTGQIHIKFDYDRVVSGKDVTQNILLNPDDVIVVP